MKWVVLRKVSGEPEAHLLKGVLENAEIPVFIRLDIFRKAIGVPLLSSKGIEVLVPEEDVEAAEEVLRET